MITEEKQLLLVDLCARLPYHPIVYVNENLPRLKLGSATRAREYVAIDKPCKPYLRPMSSMTEEEKKEYRKTQINKWVKCVDCTGGGYYEHRDTLKTFDWLNAHHFDYRGLISMGLAIEAPEGMY